jgi:hypothetical protein
VVKIKIHINGRPVGWLRNIVTERDDIERVMVAHRHKATKFDEVNGQGAASIGFAMANFVGPERDSSKAKEPVVTFQLVKV